MLNKGDNIYYYHINIKESGKVTYKEDSYEIIAAKDSKVYDRIIIIDDEFYTRLQTKKEKHTPNCIINVIRCYEWEWTHMEDELNCTVYSTCSDVNKMRSKMYKEIQKYSEKKNKKYKTYITKSNELKGE